MTVHMRQHQSSDKLDAFMDDVRVAPPQAQLYRNRLKRIIDIALLLIAALPAAIIVAVFALLISRDGHRPFYGQIRVGQNDKKFRMWKLRSMVPNADEMLRDYLANNPDAKAEWDYAQKLTNDPRITQIGKFIRKTSIDELPQLWNVFIGEMTLVGPRPMMPCQKSIYPGNAYYALRPGVTGFWQISVRNECSFAERARFDSDYLRDMSLRTDLSVLIKTVRVVIHGTGV